MSISWDHAFSEIEPSDKSKKISQREKFFGKEIVSPEQVEKIRHKAGIGLKGIAQGILGGPGDISEFVSNVAGIKPIVGLPTSKKVGEFFEKTSGEKFTPETTGEEFLEKSTTSLGNIIGLGGPLKAATKLGSVGRTALATFVPSGIATIAEKENLPPWLQASATLGSAFILHRLTGKGLKDMERSLYKRSEELTPKNASVNASHLEKNLNLLDENLKKGLEAPSESSVLKSIEKLKSKIKNDHIKIDELLASRRSLQEMNLIDELKKSPRARKLLKSVIKDVDTTLEKYGEKNPDFLKVYRQANSLHKGLQESSGIFNFIKKNPSLSVLGEAFIHYFSPFISKTVIPAAKIGKISFALARNPGLRKAYFDVLKNASKEELKGTLYSLKKFNQESKKAGLEIPKEDEWEEAYENL